MSRNIYFCKEYSDYLLKMEKVPFIDYGKELQLFRKIRRWAKEMGAPVEILQDLKKIEENRDLVHQIFSGGWDEKFEHIITYVKPLCEAEHINKTVALYKAQLLSGKFKEMSVEERLKSAADVQSYLTAKEKQEKIKKLKKKVKAVELNIEGIKKAVAVDCCLYEQLKEEVSDVTKKTVLLDLKTKRMNKQIEEWDKVTDTLKNLNLAHSVPKTPTAHSIPKTPVGHSILRKPILSPEIEAMVRSWVERYVDITKASLGPEVYETGGDADVMLDDLINDLMLPKVQVPSKDIMAALVKIVVECRKTMIKTMEENVDDQSFSEYRQSKGKSLTSLLESHRESDEELKRLRKSVRQCELELMSLYTELAEELVSHVSDDVEGEADHQEKRELVEGYLDHLVQVKRLREMKSLMKENIAVLSEEAAARSARNDAFQTYITHKRNAFKLISNLQDQLKTQGTRIRQLTETNFRTAFKACKELEFIDLKGSSFQNMKDVFLDELEQFLSYPLKIITRSWESDVNMFSPEARMGLIKKTDLAGGPDHKTINNILNLLAEYRKMISFSLPTVDTKILSLIDSRVKEVEMIKDEAVKMITEKREKVQELITETEKVQDEVDIVLTDWKELPFYDWIPGSLELDGKNFTEWQEEDSD